MRITHGMHSFSRHNVRTSAAATEAHVLPHAELWKPESYCPLISRNPALLLDPSFAPSTNFSGSGRQPTGSLVAEVREPIALYDSAYLVSPARAFSALFISEFKDRLLEQKDWWRGATATAEPTRAEQAFWVRFAPELLDIIRLFGRPMSAVLCSAGRAMQELGVEVGGDSQRLLREGVRLKGARHVRIPPEVVEFLGPILERAAGASAELSNMLPDASLSFDITRCGDASLEPGKGAMLVYRLARSLAGLTEDQYRHLLEVTPPSATGLAPLFSEITVPQLRTFLVRQLKGWVKSKVVEPGGDSHDSHEYFARVGILKAFDQAFIPWLGAGLLRELRVRGPLLEVLMSAGRAVNQKGVLPLTVEEAAEPICGVRLGDGTLLQVNQRVLDVTAAGMHANWELTRKLMALLPNEALHPAAHVGDGSWSPFDAPDGRYAPDQIKAITVVGSTLSEMREEDSLPQSAEVRNIGDLIVRLGIPDSAAHFSAARVNTLLAPYAALEGAVSLTTTSLQDGLTVNRVAQAFQFSENAAPVRAWETLSSARKLFERLQTPALVASLSRREVMSVDSIGQDILEVQESLRAATARREASTIRLEKGVAVALEYLRNHCERLATGLSAGMDAKNLRQAGAVETHLRRLAQLDFSSPMNEKQLVRAKGLAYWLAIDEQSREVLQQRLRVSRGSPGAQITFPWYRALSPELTNRFVINLHEAREALIKGARAQPWAAARPHLVLSSTLYAHSVLEFGILAGREALQFLKSTGATLSEMQLASAPNADERGAVSQQTKRAVSKFAEAFQILGINNQQLIGLIAQDLKDPRLTPEGFRPPSQSQIEALIARRASGEKVEPRERDLIDALAFAVALARMPKSDFTSFLNASYGSGELLDLEPSQ